MTRVFHLNFWNDVFAGSGGLANSIKGHVENY